MAEPTKPVAPVTKIRMHGSIVSARAPPWRFLAVITYARRANSPGVTPTIRRK